MLRVCRLRDRQDAHLPHTTHFECGTSSKEVLHEVSVGERDSEPTINQATLLKTCCCASRMAPHVTLTAAKRRADSFGR